MMEGKGAMRKIGWAGMHDDGALSSFGLDSELLNSVLV